MEQLTKVHKYVAEGIDLDQLAYVYTGRKQYRALSKSKQDYLQSKYLLAHNNATYWIGTLDSTSYKRFSHIVGKFL